MRSVLSLSIIVLFFAFAILLRADGIVPGLNGKWKNGRDDSAVFFMSDAERQSYLDSLADLVVADPESLSRLVALDIAGLFGTPDLEREDIPTVMWQYRSASCVLDFYFQIGADGEVSASPVAYFEVRRRKTGEGMHIVSGAPASSCLSAIVNVHRPAVQVAAAR